MRITTLMTITVVCGLMSATAYAVPTLIYNDWQNNPEYPGMRVGGFQPDTFPEPKPFSGAYAEMTHTVDGSNGHYNITPRFGGLNLVAPEITTALTPLLSSVDILVSGSEFAGGSYLLASYVPELGINVPEVLLVGNLKSATIGLTGDSEHGGSLRLIALFEWSYVSPLLGDMGQYSILESSSHVLAFGGPFTFDGIFGHSWSNSAPLYSTFFRAVPVDEPGSLLLFAAGLLVLARGSVARRGNLAAARGRTSG
jgi:hypothetical protein